MPVSQLLGKPIEEFTEEELKAKLIYLKQCRISKQQTYKARPSKLTTAKGISDNVLDSIIKAALNAKSIGGK